MVEGYPFMDKSSWQVEAAPEFDFRGDVHTTPTAEMLTAVTHTSMGDGVKGADQVTNALQDHVAAMTSHQDGLFVLSGTMGNLLALRCHLANPPYGILCDSRSHFLTNEAGGTLAFTGATPQPVEAANGRHLTLEDILAHVRIDDGVSLHLVPTRAIVLENTLRGMIMPMDEARRICDFAHSNGIKVHLDGARLWEAAVAHANDKFLYFLKEYCSMFDSVTMCFSKGLGAPVGAIILGSKAFIRQATWLRQSIGGSVRQPGILAACAFIAVTRTFEDGLLMRTHNMAKDISTFWKEECGNHLVHPTETNMIWLDFSNLDFTLEDLCSRAKDRGLQICRNRLVVHYQISDAAVGMLKAVMMELSTREHS